MPPSVLATLGRVPRETRRQALTLVVMTLAMGIVLSALLTLRAEGFGGGFLAAWARRFVSSYVVVLPLVAILSPVARYVAQRIEGRLFP